jgi:hypothetical protein
MGTMSVISQRLLEDEMEIDLTLEAGQSEFAALQVARLLCDVQHLVIFGLALADDDLRSEVDVFDPLFSKYEYMILGDVGFSRRRPPLVDSLVRIRKLRVASPLRFRGIISRTSEKIRRVLATLSRIIMIDLHREKLSVENEILRQRAIQAALQNHETVLRISGRIRDPVRRAQFIENVMSAIMPFADGRYPPVKRLKIIGPNRSRKDPQKRQT